MYDRAFKMAAVRRVAEEGIDINQVASEVGICVSLLARWLRQYAVGRGDAREGWRLKSLAEEKQELRREIQRLKDERDELRHALGRTLFGAGKQREQHPLPG